MSASGTVTSKLWNNSVVTGSNIDGALIQPFKGFAPNGKTRRAGCYNRRFPDSDSAWAWLAEHGFTDPYYKRPWAFIDLGLSPATRRYLRGKPARVAWMILAKLLGAEGQSAYFKAMRDAGYMADRREKWESYMAGNWQVFRQPREIERAA